MERQIMAYAHTDTQAAHGGLSARFAGLAARLRARIERNRRFRQTFKELSALSNRELADLGLSRSMLRGLAWESAVDR
jgi:uncharacterized protein YjiS (DUF1127 family)